MTRGGAREKIADLGDLQMHYLDWPAPQGRSAPPLLLVHPNATGCRVWQPFVERTAWTGRCLAPDLRGHGQTVGDGSDNSVDLWASDLRRFVDALELGPVVVMGAALGATAVLLLASHYPDLVSAVVVNDVGFDIDRDLRRRIQQRIRDTGWQPSIEEAMEAYHAADHWNEDARRLFAASMFEPAEGGVRWRYDPEAVARVMDPRPRSLLNDLAIGCPVLVLRGEHSGPMSPEAFGHLVSALPGCHHETVPGSDHVLSLDAPVYLARIVDGFLDSVLPRPSVDQGHVRDGP